MSRTPKSPWFCKVSAEVKGMLVVNPALEETAWIWKQMPNRPTCILIFPLIDPWAHRFASAVDANLKKKSTFFGIYYLPSLDACLAYILMVSEAFFVLYIDTSAMTLLCRTAASCFLDPASRSPAQRIPHLGTRDATAWTSPPAVQTPWTSPGGEAGCRSRTLWRLDGLKSR